MSPRRKDQICILQEKKGIFIGYSDHSKDYIIYILGFCHIENNRDVTFNEDAAFRKYIKVYAYEYHEEEQEAPKIIESSRTSVKDVKEEPIYQNIMTWKNFKDPWINPIRLYKQIEDHIRPLI